MRHGKGADRPSVLIINSRNREASTARREKLLAGFDGLPEDTRADLLETVETIAFAAGDARLERDDARAIIRQVYALAGLAESRGSHCVKCGAEYEKPTTPRCECAGDPPASQDSFEYQEWLDRVRGLRWDR